MPRGLHCGGKEPCCGSYPPQAENPDLQDSFLCKEAASSLLYTKQRSKAGIFSVPLYRRGTHAGSSDCSIGCIQPYNCLDTAGVWELTETIRVSKEKRCVLLFPDTLLYVASGNG